MRAPAFWQHPTPSPLALALLPAGLIYGAVTGWRMARPGARAAVPVICVGNFTAGGAGKTPVALTIADHLAALAARPAFLSRGYGGRLAGPVRIDPARHTAAEVGDEPLLLAAQSPTIVARDRVAGAQAAVAAGAGVIVMDDGLQNPNLVKDLALAVVDGATGLGNGLPLPAGPLRAPMTRQWPRVDAVVVLGEGTPGEAVAAEAARRSKPALHARLAPDPSAAAALRGQRVFAFAGIGRPEKFFATLEELGADVAQRRAFPDHHAYGSAELTALRTDAERGGLTLVTTEKDSVRLDDAAKTLLPGLTTLPVRAVMHFPEDLTRLVGGVLAHR